MIAFTLIAAALASGQHTGIPVHGVAGLGEPDFESPELGWSAPLNNGFVRVFVGQDEAAAERWISGAQKGFTLELPALSGYGDEAWGDGVGVVIWRDGNVGVLVRAEGDAGQVATALLAAVVDDHSAWPAAPKLNAAGEGRWTVAAPGAEHISVTGGRRSSPSRLIFREAPTSMVAWDAYGRAAEARP